jgi:hypothetical protein
MTVVDMSGLPQLRLRYEQNSSWCARTSTSPGAGTQPTNPKDCWRA